MGTFRRWVLPIGLGAVVVGLAATALVLDRGEATAEGDAAGAAVTTPVLSARRLPDYVTEPGADLALRLRLIELVGAAPPDSCLVVTADDRTIVAHQETQPLIPASNEKTALAAALLDVLGPEHRFTTELRAGGVDEAGVVAGDAWLVGGGDPQLSTAAYADGDERQATARTAIESVADSIAAAGITRITGRLIADESRYDSARYVPGWPERFIEQNQTGPLSALSVNDGFGEFPTPADPATELAATPDPPRLAAATLAFLLAERGVAVDGGVEVGAAPEGATTLASVESEPLEAVVGQMMTYSDNQTAELLLKELGVQVSGTGTTEAGRAALAATLEEADVDLAGAAFVDGSGLSEANRSTCALLLDVLEDQGAESPLASGLAVAGETGTLAASFVDSPAQGRLLGKTGSLNDVRSLAGYVRVPDGDDLVFALVMNRGPVILAEDAAVRDQIGLALADYPQRPPLDEVGPRPIREG
ncbi:MAG: D-alanyl-D-alanine carboxypeptidase/D-alanyl-D-alanine-endopeptidase [Actinomycetota bacterium]